jgi:hypothetical protein
MVVKKIDVLSAGKISGLLYAGVGLIMGGFVSLFSLMGAAIGAANQDSSALIGALFGVGAFFILPIFYGVLGLIGGLVGAGLYNLIASVTGGLRVEVE